MNELSASRSVQAARRAIFAFLSDLENHWHLTDRFVEVVSLDRERSDAPASGGEVRVRGPFGTRRTVSTQVTELENPSHITGEARAGDTLARVQWRLEGDAPTRVTLAIAVERASLPDRLLLGAGGGLWLERRLQGVLDTLAERTES